MTDMSNDTTGDRLKGKLTCWKKEKKKEKRKSNVPLSLSHLGCSSAHVGHHPSRHTRLKNVGGGKVVNLLQRHLRHTHVRAHAHAHKHTVIIRQECIFFPGCVQQVQISNGCEAAWQDYFEQKINTNEVFLALWSHFMSHLLPVCVAFFWVHKSSGKVSRKKASVLRLCKEQLKGMSCSKLSDWCTRQWHHHGDRAAQSTSSARKG